MGHALKESGKALGCIALAVLFVLTPVVCVGIVSVDVSAAKVHRAKLDLGTLEKSVRMYHACTGQLPGAEAGLRALVDKDLLREPPMDPWGHPYMYTVQGDAVELGSLGADRAAGGEDEDMDLVRRFSVPVALPSPGGLTGQ